jgi:uncharacterized protein (TIGR02444 family)
MAAGMDEHRGDRGGADCGEALWTYAVATYAAADVSALCLALQERHDLDVNLLLYAAWCATRRVQLASADIRRAAERCEAWRRQVVLPLRRQRQRWSRALERSAEYAAIKRLELAAEREQLQQLAQLDLGGVVERAVPAVMLDNTRCVCAAHAVPAPSVEALQRALLAAPGPAD